MSFTKYEIFLKVLELNSFSKAAEKLGYTQSTVSQTINQLEFEFGFKLINRKRHGLSLTAEGECILPYLSEAVECERKIEKKLAEINGVVEGTVNIGTYHTVSSSWISKIMKEFNHLYPGVNINHVHGNAILLKELLIDGRVDCCIMDILPNEQLTTYPLYKEKYKLILPKGYEEQYMAFELSQLDPKGVKYVMDGKGLILFNSGDKADAGKINSYTTDENVLLSMVERGLGIGLIADLALERNPYDVDVLDTNESLYRELGIIVKDMKKLSPSARELVKHIVSNDYYMNKEV